jgi:carboxymethylenebutenolidase
MRLRPIAFAMLAVAFIAAFSLMAPRSAQAEPGDAKSMAQAHQHDAPTPTPAAKMDPRVPVEAREVSYGKTGAAELKGYLARPKGAQGPLPAVIVIHEWWGLNDNVRAMTRRLAGEGYAALAVDLYAGKNAGDPEGAMKLMQDANANEAAGIANVKAAYDYLAGEQKATSVGTIGWCFGGGWSLKTALALPDKVNATVMYYGAVVTDPAKLAPLKMPILGNFAGDDKGIPPSAVKEFEKALKAADKWLSALQDANIAKTVEQRANVEYGRLQVNKYLAHLTDEEFFEKWRFQR